MFLYRNCCEGLSRSDSKTVQDLRGSSGYLGDSSQKRFKSKQEKLEPASLIQPEKKCFPLYFLQGTHPDH